MAETIFESLKSYTMTAKMFILITNTIKSESTPESVKKLISNLNVIDPVLPAIIKGQQLGEIREGDPAALALAYWGAIQGIAETYALYPNLPLPKSSWIVDVLRA